MIKRLLLIAAFLSPCVGFSQESETRNLSPFSKLKVEGNFDTFVEQGNSEFIRIVADGANAQKVKAQVVGGTLRVDLEKRNNQNAAIKIYIAFKKVDEIHRFGQGDLTCKSNLSADKFSLSSNGSGNVIVEGRVKARELNIGLNGQGDMRLATLQADDFNLSITGDADFYVSSGSAKQFRAAIAGSGDVKAQGLKTETSSISIEGSGDVEITANKSLEAAIVGSGDINYTGSAKLAASSIIGSGEINKR